MFRTGKENWLTGPVVRDWAKKNLPRRLLNEAARMMMLVRVARRSRGSVARACPVCDYRGGFDAFGDPPRYEARCRQCGGVERNRLLKLWLDREFTTRDLGEVLHFAPEDSMVSLLRDRASNYRNADIRPGRADLVLNIEEIALPDASIDTIVCLHVLEHVDDNKALSELYRILRSGGRALIMVPIVEGWARTYENPAVTTDEGRVQHFGQFDHVRLYGADLRARIASAGFALTEYTAEEPDVQSYGLLRGEKIFIAEKN